LVLLQLLDLEVLELQMLKKCICVKCHRSGPTSIRLKSVRRHLLKHYVRYVYGLVAYFKLTAYENVVMILMVELLSEVSSLIELVSSDIRCNWPTVSTSEISNESFGEFIWQWYCFGFD